MKKKEGSTNILKITFWYTVSNFLVQGIAFLTTPIFTRILTKEDFGNFSNYAAWLSIYSILTSLELHSSINRAKLEFEDKIDEYLSSILFTSTVWTLLLYLFIEANSAFFVSAMGMDLKYIRLLFLTRLFNPAFASIQAKHRAFHKYKLCTALAIGSCVLQTLISLLLVLLLDNKLEGRILGNAIPSLVLNMFLYVYIMWKGRRVSFSGISFALAFAIPLIPHFLAGNILGTSDRIMIKQMCGAEDAATYSLSYNAAMLVQILVSSMAQARLPWLYDNIARGNRKEIRREAQIFCAGFTVLALGIIMMMPEVVEILGGERYREAIYIIPPVIAGYVCYFFSSNYTNITTFYKKTFLVSICTLLAAAVNVGLNLLLIPRFGYVAAAYTTFAGYFLMVLFQYLTVRFYLKQGDLYDNKFNFALLAAFCLLIPVMLYLYKNRILRYLVILGYLAVLGAVVIKKKELLLSVFGKKKEKEHDG